MQKFVILLTYSVSLLLVSCEANDYPYVRIKTPTNRQVFNAPEVIRISAEMQSGDALSNEWLVVTKINASHDSIIINNRGQGFQGNRMYHLVDSFISEPAAQYKILAGATGGAGPSYDSIFISTN
ncbi:MAG: hypothetical protein ACJ751_24570 [Niastella sp.]|jgi:hypothetical protein|uniref:hypothetical protein n=1 Tax=Niastella sp. TaxID=1869183 RepID=UPI00389A30CE